MVASGEMIGFAQLASYSPCPRLKKKSRDFLQDTVKDKTDLLASYFYLQPSPETYRPPILMDCANGLKCGTNNCK